MLYGAWNYKMGNYAEAYSHYRQAISLNPENNKAQLGLARSASRLGKHNEAAAAYDILKTNAPENISYALNYWIISRPTLSSSSASDESSSNC